MKKAKKGVANNSTDSISKTQKQILDMFTKEYKTVKQIAKDRRTTTQAVYKIYKKLRKKGYITKGFNRGLQKFRAVTPQKVAKVRLHGVQYQFKILRKTALYDKILQHKNIHFFKYHTIQLFREILILSINEFHFFYGETAHIAAGRAIEYTKGLMNEIEEKFNIVITGEKARMKTLNSHFAIWDDELGDYVEEKELSINIRSTEDGKIWFKIDKSWGDKERECVHPETAQIDSAEVIEPFFNDLRDNKPPTLSDIMRLIKQISEHHKETAAGLLSITTYLKSQLPKKKEIDPNQKEVPDYFG